MNPSRSVGHLVVYVIDSWVMPGWAEVGKMEMFFGEATVSLAASGPATKLVAGLP